MQAHFSKHANHWRSDRGHFDAIEMLALVHPVARTRALIQRKADAIDRVGLKTMDRLKAAPFNNVYSVAGTQHYTLAMSCNKAPYNDSNVRLALKHGIYRVQLVDKILRGYGVIGNDHADRPRPTLLQQRFGADPVRADKAKFYLKQAGRDTLTVQLSAADAAFSGADDAAIIYREAAAPAGIIIDVMREQNDGY